MSINPQALPVQNMDFTDTDHDLKDFFASQDYFKDYDFNASGLDFLTKLIAFGVNKNALTANVISSEMSLDSAQVRDFIVSHAKTINYIPRSAKAAKAFVDVYVNEASTTLPNTLFLEKGSAFTARNTLNETITFITNKSYSAIKVNGEFAFPSVEIIQGTYGIKDFARNEEEYNQRYIIPSKDIDTDYIEVYVQEGNDNTRFTRFVQSTNILENTSDSNVFYLQEAYSGFYEIYFGDGVLGKSVGHGKLIRVIYLETRGPLGNDFTSIAFARTPNVNPINEGAISVVQTTKTYGGLIAEDEASIKFKAPKNYITRNRGVTDLDFENIIRDKFTDIKSVSVWGGEIESTPAKHFGKTFIALSSYASFIPEKRKVEIISDLKTKYGVGRNRFVIVDPNYFYLNLQVRAYINSLIPVDISRLESDIIFNIRTYSTDVLERFNADFEHSKLSALLDSKILNLQNNDITVVAQTHILPSINTYSSYTIEFNNAIIPGTLTSNIFMQFNIAVRFKDDKLGNVILIDASGKTVGSFGTIDYATGKISIKSIYVQLVPQTTINLQFSSVNQSIFAQKGQILKILNVSVDEVTV